MSNAPAIWGIPACARFTLGGCFGEQNAGDEALLEGALTILRKLRPEARFTVFSNDPAETAARYGVQALLGYRLLSTRGSLALLRRGQLAKVLSAAGGCDCLVIPGGEMLRTDFGWGAAMTIFDRISIARLARRPILLMGVGAGVLDQGQTLDIMRWSLKGAVVLTREETSAERARQAGISSAEPFSDLAFHVRPSPHDVSLPPQSRVAICLREPARTRSCAGMRISREAWVAGVGRLAAHLNAQGIRPIFVPFSVAESDDDRSIHREVALAAGVPVHGIEKELVPSQLLTLLGEMDAVIAMRLHSAILALSAGRPVLALSYDSKVAKQMAHFGLERFALGMEEIDQAPALFDELWCKRDTVIAHAPALIQADRDRLVQRIESALGEPGAAPPVSS